MTAEQCNNAQVAAVLGGLNFINEIVNKEKAEVAAIQVVEDAKAEAERILIEKAAAVVKAEEFKK